MLAPALQWFVDWINSIAPANSGFDTEFFVVGSLVVVFVGFICGAVGTVVVGNRMAFFSDALAHSAFAGAAIGLLVAVIAGVADREIIHNRLLPAFLVGNGILVGLLIAYVRENTSLSSDTVIGVFFALSLGIGGMVMKAVAQSRYFNLESFLFGDISSATVGDLESVIYLALLTAIFLCFMYNNVVATSFNISLARSRGVPTRLSLYLFVVLLGIIVNLCLRVVGALLINGLLIVPAATAANLSRDMRQMFWLSIVLSITVGLTGQLIAFHVPLPDPADPDGHVYFGPSGTTLVLSVILFFASMAWRKLRAL